MKRKVQKCAENEAMEKEDWSFGRSEIKKKGARRGESTLSSPVKIILFDCLFVKKSNSINTTDEQSVKLVKPKGTNVINYLRLSSRCSLIYKLQLPLYLNPEPTLLNCFGLYFVINNNLYHHSLYIYKIYQL